MFKKTIAIASLTLLTSTAVQSDDLFNAEDAVKYRQSVYQIFSAQAGIIGDMVKGDIAFNAAEMNKRATNIGKVASMLGETYFPATKDVKESRLKDAAWENMEAFQAKGQEFGEALGELITASSDPSFDIKAARKSAGALFKGCKACHTDYREK